MVPRSPKGLAAGIIISVASFLGIFFMPIFTPYEFFNCSSYGGGTQCFVNPNPAYPVVLLIGMIGIGLIFFGLFGGKYVLSPFFVIGMLLLGWGLAGLILGYIALESCVAGKFGLSCIAFASEFYEPSVLLGTILIGSNALFWKSRSHGSMSDRAFLSNVSGAILASAGIILTFFSYLVIFTRYSNYAGSLIFYWIQLGVGLFFIFLGAGLIIWSKGTGRKVQVQTQVNTTQAHGFKPP